MTRCVAHSLLGGFECPGEPRFEPAEGNPAELIPEPAVRILAILASDDHECFQHREPPLDAPVRDFEVFCQLMDADRPRLIGAVFGKIIPLMFEVVEDQHELVREWARVLPVQQGLRVPGDVVVKLRGRWGRKFRLSSRHWFCPRLMKRGGERAKFWGSHRCVFLIARHVGRG